jgi:hypothetical protein
MDDEEMDELFGLVKVGTAVTIIGTTDPERSVLGGLRKR